MWLEAQRLLEYVDRWALEGAEENSADALSRIGQFKDKILNVTKNKPKSKSPNDVLKAGASVQVDGAKIDLDDDLAYLAETVSTAFDIHQIDALQIVLAGEMQAEHFATMPRGLLAVACYYDYHRFLALILQAILRLDSETVPDDVKLFIENNFVNVSLFKHLLQVQASFSFHSEVVRLSQPEIKGLGGPDHQLLVRTIIDELIEALGNSLYYLCGWSGDRAKEFAIELYPLLKAFPVAEKLENGHMAAWTALIRLTSPEVLTKGNVTSNVLTDMVKEIRNETVWSDQSLCGTVQMACAISLRSLAVSPSDHLNIVNVEVDADRIVDRAVQNHAFKFLRYAIVGSDAFMKNVSYIKVVDSFLKKLIANFPAKLLEIERDSEEELALVEETAAKGQMIAPNLHYATFLGCLSDLYFLVDSPKLSETKKEELISMSKFYSPRLSIELARFLERSRIICHPIHAVAYLEFERAVCRTQETAAFLFDVFARVPPDQDTYIGWEQLMSTLRIYEQRFRQIPNTPMVAPPPLSSQILEIPQHELAALISWITLANKIATLDSDSAEQFIDNRSWSLIDCINGLVSAPIPIQFKGALLSLLAALACRESGVMRIWHSLNAYQICHQGDNGTLYGLQQELEERECPAKRFDVTLGMVQLLKSLFSHGSVPEFSSPYIAFLIRSVISHMNTRSYEDVHQLWEIAENSLDAVYALVRHGYTDARAVIQKDQHVQLLVQLLNDTPVFRAISTILMEGWGDQQHTTGVTPRFSQKTAFSAIKLLSLAISRHSQLRSAIRSASSDIIVANIQSMLLTPLSAKDHRLLDVIFYYLDQVDEIPVHAYYAANILRELCSVRPTLQRTITELLKTRPIAHYAFTAILKVLDFSNIDYAIDDIMKSDADTEEASKCRGETARILLEIFCDAVDTDPSTYNICYFLFGFQEKPKGHNNRQLFANALTKRTGFHNLIDVLQNFSLNDPLSSSCSALIEPAFRLMKRLTSVECIYSTEVLRFLRSNDFVVNILESGNPLTCMNQFDMEETPTHFSLSRMIVGSILNLTAIETSSLLQIGHIDTPVRIYKKLFEAVETTDTTMDEQGNSNILFSILHNNRNVGSAEVDFVSLEHFNSHKLQMISEDCKSTTSFGTPQYDIKNLHDLLKREIVSTQNESTIVIIVEKEMLKVLEYFTDLNNQLLLRGAVDSLVSGCTALLNVIAIFSPVPFFSLDSQLDLLCDAAFAIIEFTSTSTDKEALPLSATLQRIVKTISNIVQEEHKNDSDRRLVMGRILVPLLELMIKPVERPFQSKVALYESARLCLRICKFTENEIVKTKSDWLQEENETDGDDNILKAIDRFSYDLNQRIVTDISDMTIDLKVHPLLFLGDLLREDSLGSKKVASFFSKSGMPRYLVDLLATLNVDWAALSRGEQRSQIDYKAFNTIMSVLIRLAFTEPGWTVLSQLGVLEIVVHLPILNKPPSEIFLQPMSINKKGSTGNLYSQSLDLLVHLCFSLCSKPKWKRLSYKILDVVKNLSELIGQLMRAEIKCDLLSHCAELVHHIWECDEETRKSIDSEPILNSLKKIKTPIEPTPVIETKKVDFSAPTSLLKNLFPSIRI